MELYAGQLASDFVAHILRGYTVWLSTATFYRASTAAKTHNGLIFKLSSHHLYCGSVLALTSSSKHVSHGAIVWAGKPWVVPAAIFRTVIVVIFAIVFMVIENIAGIALSIIAGLPLYLWTLFAFILVWIVSLFDLLIYRVSNSYMLRQDGLQVRRGLIRLHSFIVTPSGFGDLLIYQSLGGRIFGYGDLTVNSQGERRTKLRLVRSPFTTADTIRDIMGKPIVRVENPS